MTGSRIALAMLLSSAAAFTGRPPVRHVRAVPQMSAKVLPYAYRTLSAGLAFQATRAAAPLDAAVLATSAAFGAFDLGPVSARQLASSKRAAKASAPPTTLAKRWRSVVRVKLLGEIAGLAWMAAARTPGGVRRGAVCVCASQLLFWLLGGGEARHDGDGVSSPTAGGIARAAVVVSTVSVGAALLAALAPVGSTQSAVGSWLFVGGAFSGSLLRGRRYEAFKRWIADGYA